MAKGKTSPKQHNSVLVCVLKSKRDQRILLEEHWYRIPVSLLKKQFRYLAFYQPAVFGRHGKRIEYYAKVKKTVRVKRIDLLQKEPSHPCAQDVYMKYELAWVKKLEKPIKNIIPRRVSFGFTSLKSLLSADDILELYSVARTEQMVERGLQRLGITVEKEVTISKNGKRYRIDLVVRCKNGNIAIECDNAKAHASKMQKEKDKAKDTFLRANGWHVIRLSERDIIEKLDDCLELISNAKRVL